MHGLYFKSVNLTALFDEIEGDLKRTEAETAALGADIGASYDGIQLKQKARLKDLSQTRISLAASVLEENFESHYAALKSSSEASKQFVAESLVPPLRILLGNSSGRERLEAEEAFWMATLLGEARFSPRAEFTFLPAAERKVISADLLYWEPAMESILEELRTEKEGRPLP